MAAFYRVFIPNLASIERPLRELARSTSEWNWSPDAETSFNRIRTVLSTALVLAYPDFSRPDAFSIATDASLAGIAGVLSQEFDGVERPIAYASRATTPSEQRYPATALECLALVTFVEPFRYYVTGHKFKVYTDHKALVWLFAAVRTALLYARWILRLQAYDFEVLHREGKTNIPPDVASRNPIPLSDPRADDEPEPLFAAFLEKMYMNSTKPTRADNFQAASSSRAQQRAIFKPHVHHQSISHDSYINSQEREFFIHVESVACQVHHSSVLMINSCNSSPCSSEQLHLQTLYLYILSPDPHCNPHLRKRQESLTLYPQQEVPYPQPEPLYTDCAKVLARIKDLTELYDRIEQKNNYRDSHNIGF